MMIKVGIICLAILVGGCETTAPDIEKEPKKLGQRDIKYYANKSVASLEVPPDLTKPSAKGAFKLSKYVANTHENVTDFTGQKNALQVSSILKTMPNIEVKRSGDRLWLSVDKSPEEVWRLARSFLKSNGFAIQKTNKRIGLMETDFLENHPEISNESLGLMRSLLKKALKSSYTLPVADKYRIRIEPTNEGKSSSVYLSLFSMEEVITGAGGDQENTIWQARPKDQSLETEMLYRLMVFLGSNQAIATQKILNATDKDKISVEVVQEKGGQTKLVFALNWQKTWRNISWALDQVRANVEDKDVKEGTFYINVTDDDQEKGVFARLFGNNNGQQTYQILVKQISEQKTEVYLNVVSKKTEENTKVIEDFGRKFLIQLSQQF